MEDDASILLDGKTLANLRVVDLKLELEKRGLSKSGSKKDLVKRLKQQLEFEKLCGRKSTGDCDLKIELDADTEKNEFVQQYLAQQQKIYAEQKEVKRRVELEEIQKSGDEKESCDSTKGDDDRTEDESEPELKNQTAASALSPNRHKENNQDILKDSVQQQNARPNKTETASNAEKDKELSTAISSLLSVEKTDTRHKDDISEMECEDSMVVSSRTSHDDDREKDLATAVLSSLLVDGDEGKMEMEDVPMDAQKETEVVPQMKDASSYESATVSQSETVVAKMEDVPMDVEKETEVVPQPKDTSKVAVEEASLQSDTLPQSETSAAKMEDLPMESNAQKEAEVVPQRKDTSSIAVEDASLQPATTEAAVAKSDDTSATLPKDASCKMVEVSSPAQEAVSKEVERTSPADVPSAEVHAPSETPVNLQVKKVVSGKDDQLPAAVSGKDDQLPAAATSGDVGKTVVESSEIIQPEMSSKMDVSSVPYPLAEIRLPENPGEVVKQPIKAQLGSEPVKTLDDDANSTDENIKRSDSGDLNGRKTAREEDSIAKRDENCENVTAKESDVEKPRRGKDLDSGKPRRSEASDSDSEDDAKSRRSKRKDHRKKRGDSGGERSPVEKPSKSKRDAKKSDSSKDRSKSPKKSSRKEKSRRGSSSSDDDHRSRTRGKRSSPKRESRRKHGRRHRSPDSSSDSDSSPTKSSRSPKRSHKDKRQSRTQEKDSKPSRKEQSEKVVPQVECRTTRQDSSGSEEDHIVQKHSREDIDKGRLSSTERDTLVKKTIVSKKKVSADEDLHRCFKSPVREDLRRYSEASDGESGRSHQKTSSNADPDEVQQGTGGGEKIKPVADKTEKTSRHSSPEPATDSAPKDSSLPETGRTEDSKIELPALVAKTGCSGAEHSAESASDAKSNEQDGSSKDQSPKKVLPEASKELQKADVSEGELSSSRENSPAPPQNKGVRIISIKRPSAISESAMVETSMTVIKKDAPKQRLKIKRDNVVVVKKTEEDRVSHEGDQSKSDDSHSKVPETADNQNLEPGECPEATPYVSSRKITLSNRKRNEEKTSDEPTSKRSKWGSFAASRKAKQTVSISTDSLKNWFPDFKLLKEPSVVEPVPEESPSPKESNEVDMVSVEKKDSEETRVNTVTRQLETPPSKKEDARPVEKMQVDEEGLVPTPILFIRNLVRPFTLLQLKELLKETGNIVEDKFWIDKIKSKCFVTYETEDEAVKTRRTLNGARWPTSNPKILTVDFATEEDLEYHRSGAVDQPKPRPQSPVATEHREPRPHEDDLSERRPIEREGRRDRHPVREWDKDKVTQESPEKSERRRVDDDRLKGADKDKKEGGKRRMNEETPAKLLDDLFQKTKVTPCIYWLPLTPEQAKERAEKLRQERDRRNQEQENKRPRSRQRVRDTETRSSTRSRSPVTRRR